ncbi:MAG TPA: antitoxin Xre/MbcA/ParS toxin-binding domain-containing protein [Gemmatimonadaceae bacterium]|nr:antitoxin Xre/MbcA/ParS toxin-binding domain-containing protein [Gemmatimonadaceae bacterium]
MADNVLSLPGRGAERRDLDELQARVESDQQQGHYYVALLGLRVYEPLRIYATVRKGLSYASFLRFQRNTELPAPVLADLTQIPPRTLARRKQEGRLDPEESDRLVRVARIFGRALELFEGDVRAARDWLTSEQGALGGLVPLELAKTDVGAREVDDLIGRLEHGIPT